MSLPISVTYTFATATSSIPLSQLDANFTTVVNGINGIGNGTNALSNVNITGGNITGLSAAIPAASGGTGLTSVGTSGNVLTSNGSSWISQAPTSSVPTDGFKRNRIINGNMVIDQRNSGGNVTASTTGAYVYTVDRWSYYTTQASKFTIQQNAGSVTPPAGFSKYLGFTSSSAYTSASTDLIASSQWIEGYNIADLNLGTANAKSMTVSFWAYSSLTGTFAGSLVGTNGSTFRSYVFTFTISSANTWTYITVTIPGDTTTFSYNTTNGQGLALSFNLGCGSNYQTTAGSWTSSNYYSVSGAQNITATSGATLYITGVQLEAGSVATPYEFNPYSDQLAQCQRYFYVTTSNYSYQAYTISGQSAFYYVFFPVQMRVAPTISSTMSNTSCSASPSSTTQSIAVSVSISSTTTFQSVYSSGNTASAEL